MTELYKVVGPPGTGKTTWISQQVARAAASHGERRVLVCSLTRAAAREAAGATLDVGVDVPCGTIHSVCWRALGRPKVVDRKSIEEWNKEHPSMALSPGVLTRDGEAEPDRPGDELLVGLDLARARMMSHATPTSITVFRRHWTEFKEAIEAVDFSDMVERGLNEVLTLPDDPLALFVDEAQDLSRLELSVVRRWASSAQQAILVGDPDQALYDWRGADPEVLAPPVWKVLSRSYRVPRAVHARALGIIRHARSHVEAEYSPRDADGAVRALPFSIRDTRIVSELEEAEDEGTVMLLASCAYMLTVAVSALREAGVPYHNPYGSRWNPLRPGGTSTGSRVEALLAGARDAAWTPSQLRAWVPMVRATGEDAVLRRGAKKALSELPEDDGHDGLREAISWAKRWISDVNAVVDVTPATIAEVVTATWADRVAYPARVAERRGVEALARRPRIVVGTIHSVKGGQADRVIVAPDLSPAGWESWRSAGWNGRDSVLRTFYVAVTRAREELRILAPAGGLFAEV